MIVLLAFVLVVSEPIQVGRGVRVIAGAPQPTPPGTEAPEIAACLDGGRGSCITPRLVFRPGSRASHPQVIR